MATNRRSVATMINDAIATLNEKGGSSLHAIKKYIAATYKVDVQKLDPHLKKALKKGVESGSLKKATGKGISGSFKLADKPKTTKKPVGGKDEKTKKEKVAAYPKEKKIVKEVKAIAVRVSPKKARANKKVVPTARASKPPAKKKAAASKEEVENAKVPEVVEKEEADSSPDSDGFLKMLRIDLVMEELLQHFSVEGMKILSLVSKDALIAVRKSKVFSDRVQFIICGDSIRSRVLGNCFYSWKAVKFRPYDASDRLAEYLPKSKTISQCLNSLQSFSFWVSYQWATQESLRDKINTVGLKIIESSNETLEDLDLRLYIPCSGLDGFEFIRCPNLKSLGLSFPGNFKRQSYDELVRQLLKSLPPLEKLTVDVCHPSKLFAALQGRMSKLRELGIRIRCLSCKDSTLARAFDWNLAAEMASLEGISIDPCLSYCKTSAQDVKELLLSIPPKTVTKISLANFWEWEVRFIQKLHESISRFTKLTELSLCCLKSFDDDSLQGIIRRLPNLKNLSLVELNYLTDFGISGVKKSPTDHRFHLGLEKRGVSLADLRDLDTLTIESCGTLSLATLLEVIRVESITSLKFKNTVRGWEAKSPREFLLQIPQLNPSLNEVNLEIVGIADQGDDQDDDHYSYFNYVRYRSLEHEARRLFPQIQKLKFAFPMTGEYSESDCESSDSDSD